MNVDAKMRQKILVPLDGSAFSHQIVSTVCSFFSPEKVELILFEVVSPSDMPYTGGGVIDASEMVASAISSSRGEAYRQRRAESDIRQYQRSQAILHQHEQTLAESEAALVDAGYHVQAHAEMGEPAEQIVAYAKAIDADLIAMATHGRSGISKLVMGSVAERVLHDSPVPVMLLRPALK